jgi:hypothetical protein
MVTGSPGRGLSGITAWRAGRVCALTVRVRKRERIKKNREWGVGSGEWGLGNGEWGSLFVICMYRQPVLTTNITSYFLIIHTKTQRLKEHKEKGRKDFCLLSFHITNT